MDDNAIKVEISNHISLGQWELARSLILVYWNHPRTQEANRAWITQILIGVCAHPEKSCIGSLTLKSVNHLAILALQLIGELGIKLPEVSLLRKIVEIKLYLYKASKCYDDVPYDDIGIFFEKYQLYSEQETALLPAKIVHFLYDLKTKDALLASVIQKKLLENHEKYSESLSLTWIRKQCQTLKKNENDFEFCQKHAEELLSELRCYIFFFSEVDKFLAIPEDICKDILYLCGKGILDKRKVYSALLVNPAVAEKYCETEDRLLGRFEIESELESAENFLSAIFLPNGVVNAKELCSRCVRAKKHFLQMILDHLVIMVINKKYDEVLNYLNYPLTCHIRPILILRSWDQIINTEDAIVMLDHLWSHDLDKENYDPVYVKSCDKLFQQVELAQWCIQKREKFPECATNIDCNFNKLCASLKTNSILRVLHDHLRISKLDQVEIEEVLKKYTPPLLSGWKRDKSVRFDTGLFEENSYKIIQQSVDCKIFHSYRVMTSALEAINFCTQYNSWCREKKQKKNGDSTCENDKWNALYKEKVLGNLETTKQLIKSLYPLAYRLEILGNLFFLIFATQNDLKTDTNSDTELSSETDELNETNDKIIDVVEKTESNEDEQIEDNYQENGQLQKIGHYLSDNYTSMSTCSSTSGSTGNHFDFLCDDTVICSLLSIIKDNLLDISLKFDRRRDIPNLVFWDDDGKCNVIKEKKFLQAVTELKKQVSDAIWRFEIVAKSSSQENETTDNTQLYKIFSQIRKGKQSRKSGKSSSTCSPNKSRRRYRSYLHSTYFEECTNSSCSHGTVNKMLSSKESMLNLCMQQMDTFKAQQVIQTFSMEKTDAAAEIIFALKYSELVDQFQTPKENFRPLLPSFSSSTSSLTSSLSQIQLTAAAGINATVDATAVDDFLSRCTVPTVIGMEEYLCDPSKLYWNEIKECQDLRALVLCDLAFTKCQSLESCSSLLHAAIKRIESVTSITRASSTNHSDLKGLGKFAIQIQELVSEIVKKQNCDLPLFTQTSFSKVHNLRSLFAKSVFPLKAKKYSNDVDDWNILYVNLRDYYSAQENYENQEMSVVKARDARISMHRCFINLVRNETLYLRSQLDENSKITQYPNYLRSIYVYLRQLATLIGHHNPDHKDSASSHSFLDCLNEELMSTLVKMVSDEIVNLEWVEKFIFKFRIDLAHVITQACVGVIPVNAYSPVRYKGYSSNKFGQFILNCQGCKSSSCHPDEVARKLMQNLLNFINDNCSIINGVISQTEFQKLRNDAKFEDFLRQIDELSVVDLKMLENEEQCLSFLLNVCNLLSVHAILLRDYDKEKIHFGLSRILAESCQVSYRVGQFGVISLLELRSILSNVYSQGLQIPSEVLEIRKEVLNNKLTMDSRKVSFLMSSGYLTSPKLQVIFANDIHTQIKCGITDYLNTYVSVDVPNKKVFVPDLVSQYAKLHSENENVLSVIVEYCKGDLLNSLTTAKEKGYSVVASTIDFQPVLVVDYFRGDIQSVTYVPKPERKNVVVQKIPTHVRKYLREKSWLADNIIDILDGKMANDEKCVVLNRFVNQFEESQRVDALIPAYHEVNFWLQLDEYLAEKNWENVLEFINSSFTMRIEARTYITPLLDFIFCHLSQFDDDFRLMHKIKNIDLQAYYILANYKKLEYTKCRDFLLNIGTDSDLSKSLSDEVNLIRKRVEVYEKIKENWVEVEQNWQEIQRISEEDPEKVLSVLYSQQNYPLALDWVALHSIPEQLEKLAQAVNLMQYLDQREPDIMRSTIVLENISNRTLAVEVCNEALSKLDILSSQSFIIDYLLHDLSTQLSESRKEELHLMNMGIKILTILPESDRKYFVELLPNPILTLEQLIMNMKIEFLEKSLKTVTNDITANYKDLLKFTLKKYAKKSLEVPIIQPKYAPNAFSNSIIFNKNESFTIPLHPPKKEDWIPDETVQSCMVCQNGTFHMFNRRHHCRRCGRVVCASCSAHTELVKGYDDVKVRVCDDCKELYSSSSGVAYAASLEKRIRSYGNNSSLRSPSLSSSGSNTNSLLSYTRDENYVWQLKLSEDHNATVRQEFNFDQTPNVSLCISLLDCYLEDDECASYMLELSEELFSVLQPIDDSGVPNPEVNHSMIINVIETLIVSAKFKFANSSLQNGMATCDVCLNNLNLVKLLITSNCYHLVPRNGISSQDGIRRLRDQLVAEERWSLALEVTTKNPLDASAVWFSWGLAILKTYDFPAAREKLSHCFEKSSDGLLSEIIKQLELNLYCKENEMINVRNSLATLQAIRKQGSKAYLLPKRSGSYLNVQIFDECLFYLCTYGTNHAVISFLLKHDKINIALRHILDKECDLDIFIHSLFIPCVRNGKLEQLEQELRKVDATLNRWNRYLNAVCTYLHRQKLLHTLLEVQLFCQDYIRAYATCVNLFCENASDYSQLHSRLNFLEQAKTYLTTAQQLIEEKCDVTMKQPKWIQTTSSLHKELSSKEIQVCAVTIDLQIRITNYFNETNCNVQKLLSDENSGDNSPDSRAKRLPTFFGNSVDQMELSAMVILAGTNVPASYRFSADIIQKLRLDHVRVFSLTGRQLVKKRRFEETKQLIKCVAENHPVELVDEVIVSCLLVLGHEAHEAEAADELMKFLKSYQHKINAYILRGKLKTAYLLAVNHRDAIQVQRIAAAAERTGRSDLAKTCAQWLIRAEK